MNKKLIFNNDTWYIVSSNNETTIIDTDNDKMMKDNGIGSCLSKGMKFYSTIKIPDEYKNKYCLLFGGHVLYSFDTKEELVPKTNYFTDGAIQGPSFINNQGYEIITTEFIPRNSDKYKGLIIYLEVQTPKLTRIADRR